MANMFEILDTRIMYVVAREIPSILVMTCIKWTVVFTFVCLLMSLFKKLSCDIRHAVWAVLIYGLIFIVVLSLVIPLFNLDTLSHQKPEGVLNSTISFFLNQTVTSFERGYVAALTGASLMRSVENASFSRINWNLLITTVWIAGVFIASLRIMIGRIALTLLYEKRHTSVAHRLGPLFDHFSTKAGVRRPVRIRTSPRCIVPFTHNTINPLIILPEGAESWPVERIRAVLFHELAHIRRGDCLTRNVARLICSLFWFIPFVWIAYHHLYEEQEKACDQSVIERGVGPANYAAHILNLARIKMGMIPVEGSFLSQGRKKILERRILYALSLRKNDSNIVRGRRMKVRTLILCVILLIAVFIIIGSCATNRKVVMSEEEIQGILVGTWTNSEYNKVLNHGKYVIHPDGGRDLYFTEESDVPACTMLQYTFDDVWKDSRGNMWYRARWIATCDKQNEYYELGKLDRSHAVWELVFAVDSFPTELVNNSRYVYWIYYR